MSLLIQGSLGVLSESSQIFFIVNMLRLSVVLSLLGGCPALPSCRISGRISSVCSQERWPAWLCALMWGYRCPMPAWGLDRIISEFTPGSLHHQPIWWSHLYKRHPGVGGRVLNIKSEHLGINANGSASYKAALTLLSLLRDMGIFESLVPTSCFAGGWMWM